MQFLPPEKLTEDLIAPKVIVQGPIATGKSTALKSIIRTGMQLFVVQTEPNEVLDDISCSQGLHIARAFPAQIDIKTLIENAKRINQQTMKQLQENPDPNKYKYTQFIDFLLAIDNFTCVRCKQAFGSFDSWKADRCLAVDGMTGLSQMALDLAAGSKPIRSQPEWGAAMDNLDRLIVTINSNANAMFVLLAHVERETDEVSGGVKNMVATLGRKLAPKIPRTFSDVIVARKILNAKGNAFDFYWDTSDTMSECKTRNLPIGNMLAPDFGPLITTWKKRYETALAQQLQDVSAVKSAA